LLKERPNDKKLLSIKKCGRIFSEVRGGKKFDWACWEMTVKRMLPAKRIREIAGMPATPALLVPLCSAAGHAEGAGNI